MSNSNLVDLKKISPNRSMRTSKIDTISIHCVVGQWSIERIGEEFSNSSKKASSNYGIGSDGRIGMYVEEKERSWCTSSSTNDNRAVTIEVASDRTHPYKVTNEAYQSLINLVADICKRNNIEKLKWQGDKNLIGQVSKQNMTVHRWFSAKDCPGDYLYNLHGDIAKRVNEILKNDVIHREFLVNEEIKKLKSILYEDENYVRLRDLEQLGLKIEYNIEKRMPIIKF